MENSLFLIPVGVLNKHAISEIVACYEITFQYCLSLTPSEAKELVETRTLALKNNGRIEVGGGIIDKIIMVFCDSPYMSQHNYAETLHELVEIFYFFKNETLDLISDDELIDWMKKYFDTSCQGSLDLLKSRELVKLAHEVVQGCFDFSAPYDLCDYYDGGAKEEFNEQY